MRLKHLPVLVLPLLFAACGGGGGSSNGGGSIQPLAITTTSLPDANLGQFYTTTLQATGGTSPYTWSMTSGSLPVGLSFAPGTATLSGTPTAVGVNSATFEVMDANGFTVDGMLDLEVLAAPPLTINANTLPTGSVGSLYSTSLSATGGVVPYTWTVISGNLPNNFSLNAQTGEISGTPTVDGVSSFDIEVTDALSTTAQAPMQITVAPAVSVVTSGTLPNAYDGIPYYARFDATGGQAPYNWGVVSGTLPTGLSLNVVNNGVAEITGTPTQVGAAQTFDLEVTDSLASAAQLGCSVDVLTPQQVASSTVEIVTTNLPRARTGEYYEQLFQAAGGLAPFWWDITSGALPPGMYIDDRQFSTTTLRGRPTRAGVYTFEISANDNLNLPGARSLTIIVEHHVESLPVGAAGTEYNSQSVVNGNTGTTPSLAFASVASVPGLTLGLQAGAIVANGTPAGTALNVFSLEITDNGFTHNQLVSLEILPAPATLSITTTSLADGIRGSGYTYSQTVSVAGGSGAGYSWALVGGSLPPGTLAVPSVSAPTITLAGSFTQSGTFPFTLEVTDSASNVATANLSITVNDPTPNDFNGDGFADLIVGSSSSTCGTGIELFLAEPAQHRYGHIGVRNSDLTIEGRGDQCGFGDFNGDGVADIVICSVPDYSPPGYISILYGSSTNPTLGTTDISNADCRITGNGNSIGAAMAVGDLDGDGFDDIIVGAPTATTSVTNGGKSYVFYGGSSALQGSLSLSSASLIYEGNTIGTTGQTTGSLPTTVRTNGYYGDSFLATDLNGDGRDDIVAGATSRAFVLYSPATRRTGTLAVETSADATFQNCTSSRFPARLAVGNINGDASPDLVVGGEYTYLFYGSTSGQPFSGTIDASGANAVIDNSTLSSAGAFHMIGVGLMDWDQDGVDDIFIGSASLFTNVMFAFLGSATSPPSGTLDPANAYLTFDFPSYSSIAAAGPGDFIYKCDYNADGVQDLMFAAQGYQYENPLYSGSTNGSAGAVFVIYGNSLLTGGVQNPENLADLKIVGRTDGSICGNDGPVYGVSGGGG